MSHKVGQLRGIIIDKLSIQLRRNLRQRVFRGALTRTYATWAPHHWEWVEYCFNEHFVMHKIAPYLICCLEHTTRPELAELANTWAEQFTWFDEKMRQRHIARLIPAVSNFLTILEAELSVHPEFQPGFNSYTQAAH